MFYFTCHFQTSFPAAEDRRYTKDSDVPDPIQIFPRTMPEAAEYGIRAGARTIRTGHHAIVDRLEKRPQICRRIPPIITYTTTKEGTTVKM